MNERFNVFERSLFFLKSGIKIPDIRNFGAERILK